MLTWEDSKRTLERVLPKVAAATSSMNAVLVGGTALAWQLEHRASSDLDVQTLEEFDEQALADRLVAEADSCEVLTTAPNIVVARVDSVKVEVWKSSTRQTTIEDGPIVLGMRLASLPDLFALKLRAVRNRAQLRDYVDIATLMGVMTLEDGIRAYALRFGLFLIYDDLFDVFSVLTPPPSDLSPDPLLDPRKDTVLNTVHVAAEQALAWITEQG